MINSDQLAGIVQSTSGRFAEIVGLFLSSPALERCGFDARIAGEARRAIGDAQQLIDACRRHTAQASAELVSRQI